MQGLGEHREGDGPATLAGGTGNERAEYHGRSDLPVFQQSSNSGLTTSELVPGKPGEYSQGKIEDQWPGTTHGR